MSDLVKHILVADAIGAMLAASPGEKAGIPLAFGLGMASHAVMDLAEPDFTVNWFNLPQLKSATPFLGFQLGGIAFVLRVMHRETRGDVRAFRLRTAAILGAVLPDVIDGAYSILNPHAWYSGRLLFPWHVRTWQVNPMSMWATGALSCLLLGARYLLYPLIRGIRGHVARVAGGN